ncbi:MAG: hypothetical protein KJP25_10290 [Gammaproteobacteria bacterium]|nr:hypothetical protein [Gammaproteobacteria bacterium]MBT8152240.1 hypothetical protein [Gammaproteobacteria bacterium]NND38062.1 hypothetical protein [Pseudomonadales bacterium]NNL11254.1 hypothetical protein [Pseudomonadales bacterium]NNM12637.1 hypothetical protein [Pseudomonadales bacterium]
MTEASAASMFPRLLRGVFLLALLIAFFYWGRISGLGAAGDLQQRNKDLARQVNQQTIALREAKAENVRLAKAAEIDRLAAEEVRRELLTYRQETADLQRDVDFFRGLMAPDELQRGLRLHSFDISYNSQSGRYSYKAVIINAGGKGNVIKGQLKFSLVAAADDGNKEFGLDELPDFQGNMPVKLRFRFFQNIQGSFKLPANYEPVSINASANVRDKAGAYFKASYRWGNLVKRDPGVSQ